MATKNITVKVDESVYHRAREIAAEKKTSVSALVSEFLDELNIKTPPSEKEMERRKEALQALWKLSDAYSSEGEDSIGPFNREDAYDRGISRQ